MVHFASLLQNTNRKPYTGSQTDSQNNLFYFSGNFTDCHYIKVFNSLNLTLRNFHIDTIQCIFPLKEMSILYQ